MQRTSSATDVGFRRQVCFRLSPEEWPLLEAAARAHGGIQAGLLAALRTHAGRLLSTEPAPHVLEGASEEVDRPKARRERAQDPLARDATRHEQPGDRLIELNLAEAAPLLGIRPATLRKQIKAGRRPGRQGENGYWLAQLPARELRGRSDALSARGAAELLGVKPATIKRRCETGRYANARREPTGWRIPISDLV